MSHQGVLYEFDITAFFVPAAKEKVLLYAGIFSDAENISELHDKGMPEILKHLYGINWLWRQIPEEI